LRSNYSNIRFEYDNLNQLQITEFKIDGVSKKFPELALAEESRQNLRDVKLAILNILAIFSGVAPEILTEKITFDIIGERNAQRIASETNGPGEVSLSVPLYDIELSQSEKTLVVENFDLIIDVRTPKEFEDDHIPGAVNMPVLNNEQRHDVGSTYAGDATAGRETGASLICRSIANMIEDNFLNISRSSRILVYCWRGGLRSKSLAVIMKQIQFNDVKLLKGGYKTFRAHVMSTLPP